MKVKENEGVDISSFTSEESPETNQTQETPNPEGEQQDFGQLFEELGKNDPALMMVVEQLFQQGEAIAKLRDEMEATKRYVTYLIANDPTFQDKVKAAEEKLKAEQQEESDVEAGAETR